MASIDTQSARPANPVCLDQWSTPTALDTGKSPNDEKLLEAEQAKCALQKHQLRARASDFQWQAGTGSHDDATNPRQYYLAFLEFGQDGSFAKVADPASLHNRQLADLRKHLASQKQNYLIVYVHGWRHDARPHDKDVEDLRLLAAFARSFLNQRCADKRRYCDTTVTALYVGWRGSPVNERIAKALTWPAAMASIVTVKPQSEVVAPYVLEKLKILSDDLDAQDRRRNRSSVDRNKMLVFGHSAGANMLLTGLLEPKHAPLTPLEQKIASHRPGEILKPELGDLVLLINAASEGTNWAKIQNAVHRRGLELGLVDAQTGKRKSPLFRKDQPPLLVSMTSSCGFSSQGEDTSASCDNATGQIFPIYRVLTGHFSAMERKALGHMDKAPSTEPGFPATLLTGPTHQLDINHGPNKATEYTSAFNRHLSRCEIVDGWLLKAREARPGSFADGWDAGKNAGNITPANSQFLLPTGQTARLESQFLHGFTGETPATLHVGGSPVSGTDPFWNVKAHTGAISKHGGYVSYMTWCAVNQMVLDDIIRH